MSMHKRPEQHVIDADACKQLGVTGKTVVYECSVITHQYDDDEFIDVPLPAGWRLVGVRDIDGDAGSPRVFGFVDFTGLGAK